MLVPYDGNLPKTFRFGGSVVIFYNCAILISEATIITDESVQLIICGFFLGFILNEMLDIF